MENQEVLLNVKGVSKSFYGNLVLDRVDLTVRKGEAHALCGENGAGKSTLMNVITGVLPRDGGEVLFDGESVDFHSPRESVERGIGFLHQEMALCQHLSVAENIFMWRIPQKKGLVDYKALYSKTEKLLALFHTDVRPQDKVMNLSVAQQQVVEIAKALSMNAKLIILDEPTSSITEQEAENLFGIIRDLKAKGIGIIYISHRMNEIFDLCDKATVLRDGHMVKCLDISSAAPDEVITGMVGREIKTFYPPKSSESGGDIVLRVEHLTSSKFKDVSFQVEKGRILGFSGLVGAGRSEVARAVCGLDSYLSGTILYKGEQIKNSSYGEAIRRKICYLTEDRKKNGLFLRMSVQKNLSAAVLQKVSKRGILSREREKELALSQVRDRNIRTQGVNVRISSLSGGNQQKAMIGKWLAAEPELIILDEPTRGIDVGAKSEIHHMLRRLCGQGIGVVMISSEMPEIIGMCDDVCVMHEGRVTGTVSGADITENNLMMLASGRQIHKKEEA